MSLTSLSSCADVAELQRAGEGRMQLGVHRHDPGLAALALANTNGGPVTVQRQVPCLDRQRLRDPEPGSPLDQKQQPRPGIWSCTYECVNLVGLEILRELLNGLLIDVTTVAWDAGPWGGGSARRLWSVGLPRLDFPLACVLGHFLRAIVPNWRRGLQV